MRTLIQIAGIAAVALAATTAQATDFKPLMEVVHATWPEKGRIGVVADYSSSQDEILDLAREAGSGTTITVLDTRGRGQLERASQILTHRVKPDYVVLLRNDPVLPEGSFQATRFVALVASVGIPTIGTTAKGLDQGAVFAMGAGTGMELLVAHRMIGTVEVILPTKARFLNQARLDHGMAEVSVVDAF